MQLRVGLIGCGRIAYAHLRGYKNLPELFSVVACCDINLQAAKALAQELNSDVAIFDNYRSLLEHQDVDIVDITLPHSEHAPAVIESVNAGKHVLVEKPMATNLRDACQMVYAAQQKSVTLMVAQTKRYSEIYRKMKSLIVDGAIGEPIYIRAGVDSLLSELRSSTNWLLKKSIAGGGVIMSNGVHLIDLLRWLVGEVNAVYALTRQSPLNPTMDCEDVASCLLEFENEAIGDLACLYAAKASPWSNAVIWGEFVLIYGTEGILHNIGDEIRLISGPERKLQIFNGFNDDPFQTELEHFHFCVLNGCEPLSSGRDNLNTIALIEAIYLSAEKQSRITVSEVWDRSCLSQKSVLKPSN
ncbi:MAG: Gfo/Idh/MocA family oxidoreductase [Armatimonadetes bacterium]|nr:Gfo/Idh/MocA family oxidoreductase [Armatimonadota bacterium]MDW8028759.1 Gfo/Idh/MocA family oxidoreductase [Armatimonadota bacterium]